MTARANCRRMELLRAERRLCRGSQGPTIAALSRYVVDQLHRHYGTDPRRVVLTLNGVATNKEANAGEVQALRARIAGMMGGNPVLFLFVAHNFRLKGLDRLIRAMQLGRRGNGGASGLPDGRRGRPDRQTAATGRATRRGRSRRLPGSAQAGSERHRSGRRGRAADASTIRPAGSSSKLLRPANRSSRPASTGPQTTSPTAGTASSSTRPTTSPPWPRRSAISPSPPTSARRRRRSSRTS